MLPAEIQKIIDSGRPLLLDGGLGGELARRGFDLDSPLWSADLIRSDPAALRAVHCAYLEAGASGFGIGSALYKPGKSLEDVRRDALAFVQAYRQSR